MTDVTEVKTMKEDLKKVLRQTTITMTISICALVMGIILIFVSWKQGQKVSVVGIIIVIAMIINIIPAVKKRREIKDEIAASPRLYR